MCARRFLMIVFVLTVLVVAGAFAVFQFGDRVLIEQAVPKGHFEPARPTDAPDYRSDDSWLTRPGALRPDDPTEWRPDGTARTNSDERPAALFYVHPTTYLERDRWNAPLRPAGSFNDVRTRLFLQSQASAFTDVALPWVPRYRQAAFGAFLLKSADATKALDLAYGDVEAAFHEFLREAGDRPIILAGHSQGALHLERLLKEKVAGQPVADRIVAAYVVGWPISTTADLPALGLPPCSSAQQTGCILSWMTFGEPANASLILKDWSDSPGLNGGERRKDDILCVNPISGVQNGAAPPQANPGTLTPSADLRSGRLEQGLVGGHCDKGLLILNGAVPPLGPYVLPGNNYHVYDYALFWGAVQRDVARRLAAWTR